MPRRKYSDEFKLEAVRLTQEPGVTQAQVARDLGIGAGLLGRWVKEFKAHGGQAFQGSGRPRDEETAPAQTGAGPSQEGTGFFKRSGGVLRQRTEVKYRFMDRCRDAFPVRLMCRCLNVSPSGYYSWRRRPLSHRAKENRRLLQEIRELHAFSDGAAGSPGIWRDLRYRGETMSLNRVARLMRVEGLRGIPQKKRWKGKQPGQRPALVENVIARDFQATEANTKWATDITYISGVDPLSWTGSNLRF